METVRKFECCSMYRSNEFAETNESAVIVCFVLLMNSKNHVVLSRDYENKLIIFSDLGLGILIVRWLTTSESKRSVHLSMYVI